MDDIAGDSPLDLIVVVPLSSSRAPSALRVEIPPSTGIDRPSLAICRAVRALTPTRFTRRIGRVQATTLREIESRLALILGMDTPDMP